MSRWLLLLLPVLALPSLCSVTADEPVTPVPLIVLPLEPVAEPSPAADPQPVSTIKADEWYVIGSQVPLIVITSPDGVLRVDHEAGPMRLRGKFAGGSGVESRTFTEPHLYFVEPLMAGKSELILIPEGVTEAAAIVRQVLTVAGLGPEPPPIVDPPVVDPVRPVTGFRVLFLANEDANRDELNTLSATVITAWLNDNCVKSADGRPEWRNWDRTSVSKPGMLSKETKIWRDLWEQIQPQLPAGNILVIATDHRVSFHEIGTPDETLKLLKQIKAGK